MKRIGFIGAYDKTNFIIYTAKVLTLLDYKVLVIDASDMQKTRYIVPAINPSRAYMTSFENIDFAIGFKSLEEIEKVLGVELEQTKKEPSEKKSKKICPYDYILIDVDNQEKIEDFEIGNADKNYFVTAFDMFSLKKGIGALKNLAFPMKLTKILFNYEMSKADEEYLNYISLECRINWEQYSMYFKISDYDEKIFEENQRLEKIRFKRLSPNYKDSLAYVIQDIDKNENLAKIKRIMKD